MILDHLHSLVIQKTKDRVFLEVNRTELEQICKILIQAFQAGNRLYLCGNGGSCADADHIAAEFIKDFRIKRKRAKGTVFSHRLFRRLQEGLPAVSLSGLANVTAIANDMDYSLVYAQQLYTYAKKGDVLFLLSASGQSSNVINAAYTAREIGVYTIGFTGNQKENRLRSVCRRTVAFKGQTAAAVQEGYMQLLHTVCEIVESAIFNNS